MKIRLQKYLAEAGVASRRKSEQIIAQKRVAVNGVIVTQPGTLVDTERDLVVCDGVTLSRERELVYIMLHKPEGYITTVRDQFGRRCVTELIANRRGGIRVDSNGGSHSNGDSNGDARNDGRIVPVGRLDYDTSGLLLLTNDGETVYKLTHPKHRVEKTYIATVSGRPDTDALQKLRAGVYIDGRLTAPAGAALMESSASRGQSRIKITIAEGRNRQVRKMCEAVGHPVRALKRVAIGELRLSDLKKGEYRELTNEEIEYIRRL